MRYRITDNSHEGHPDVAGQYSQGTFTVGYVDTNYLDDGAVLAGLESYLEREAQTWVGRNVGDSVPQYVQPEDVEVDASQEDDVTLTVYVTCGAEDHDGEDCRVLGVRAFAGPGRRVGDHVLPFLMAQVVGSGSVPIVGTYGEEGEREHGH